MNDRFVKPYNGSSFTRPVIIDGKTYFKTDAPQVELIYVAPLSKEQGASE